MPPQNVVAPGIEVRRDLLPSVWPGDDESAVKDSIASAELEVDADHLLSSTALMGPSTSTTIMFAHP